MIYLDHAATTPMRPRARDAMRPHLEEVFGNPSGVHEVSRRAKNSLEEARERIAGVIGARPHEIVLTSGGTESDNLALKGAALAGDGVGGVVTVATEHEAILETTDFLRRRGHPTTVLGVGRDGSIDIDAVLGAIDEGTSVVSVMLVNNETGLVQDIPAVSAAIRRRRPGVLVHTDAAQAFSSEDVDVGRLGVDLLTVSGHKFGAPKGVGLLYVREGTPIEPVLHGGGQELGRRSGTHDVAGAVALAAAMEEAAGDRRRFREEIGAVAADFEKRLVAAFPDVEVNTPENRRAPHILNMRFPGVRNETLLMRLDRAGVAASPGSACQSGASEVSHVLRAMGRTVEEARQSIRFSFGWTSTLDESVEAADLVAGLVEELR